MVGQTETTTQEVDTSDLEVTQEQVIKNDKTETELSALPEKFKGKSLEEVVNSYQELESTYGKQGQELGEYRKLADTFLQDKIASQTTAQNKQVVEDEELDFLGDPEVSVEQVVNKRVQVTENRLEKAEKALMERELKELHPDFQDTVKDIKFQDWISQSKYRTALYQNANHNFDLEAATEMFEMWNIQNPRVDAELKQIDKEATKKKRIGELTTESGASGQSSSKKYSRKELIRLKSTDPGRYKSLSPLIRQAYIDNRVVD